MEEEREKWEKKKEEDYRRRKWTLRVDEARTFWRRGPLVPAPHTVHAFQCHQSVRI